MAPRNPKSKRESAKRPKRSALNQPQQRRSTRSSTAADTAQPGTSSSRRSTEQLESSSSSSDSNSPGQTTSLAETVIRTAMREIKTKLGAISTDLMDAYDSIQVVREAILNYVTAEQHQPNLEEAFRVWQLSVIGHFPITNYETYFTPKSVKQFGRAPGRLAAASTKLHYGAQKILYRVADSHDVSVSNVEFVRGLLQTSNVDFPRQQEAVGKMKKIVDSYAKLQASTTILCKQCKDFWQSALTAAVSSDAAGELLDADPGPEDELLSSPTEYERGHLTEKRLEARSKASVQRAKRKQIERERKVADQGQATVKVNIAHRLDTA